MASRASSDVVVRFIGDTGNLDKGLNNLSGRFTAVTSSLQGIAQAGAVVGAISFFKGAIEEAEEAARIGRKTQAVVKSTGQAAGVTADQVGELAGKLSDLAGVDDEVIQQGENVLLTFTKIRNEAGKGNDIFNQASLAALDMAAALDKTGDTGAAYQENVIRLGKALQDPIAGLTALKKVGVSFSDEQKTQIETMVAAGDVMGAQKLILAELNREFGGMAVASATATGKAAVAWGNFAEAVGEKVMPAVEAVGDWLNNTGIPALGEFADTVEGVVAPVAGSLVDAGQGAVSVWQALPAPVQNSAVALGAWALAGDKVTNAMGRVSSGARGLGADVSTAMGAFDVGRAQGTLMVLEEHVPVIGRMGQAYRDNASAGLALANTMPGLSGAVLQFSSVAKGAGAAALTGLKAGAAGVMGLLGGPWGLALAGATFGLSMLAQKSAEAKARQQEFYNVGKQIAAVMREQTGAINAKTRAQVVDKAEESGLLAMAQKLGISTRDVTDALLGNEDANKRVAAAVANARGEAEGQDSANSSSISNILDLTAGTEGHTAALDIFSESLARTKAGTEEGAQADNRKKEAMGGVKDATVAATAAEDEYLSTITDEKTAVDAYKTAVSDLTSNLQEYWSTKQSIVDSAEGWEASWDGLTTSIQENGASLDITTEKGRANRDAIEASVAASQTQMQADIASGMSMELVTQKHNDRINALIGEATRLGLNKQETESLITAYGGVPDQVSTDIIQSGFDAVNTALLNLGAVQMLLKKGDDVTPDSIRRQVQANKTYAANSAYFEGRAPGRAGGGPGGPVRGPGTGTSDTAGLYRLSNREFVQRAAATQYYGEDFMWALNQMRIPREALPGLAQGGLVRAPFPVDMSKTWIPSTQQVSDAYLARHPEVGRVGQMQTWARQQAGKRYLWGAVGPNNYDCSGLVGNLYAMAKGLPMYRRYFTTAGMGPGRFGMESGPGKFTVYLGPGHTAANVGGMHVEAYGGNGTPVAVGRVGTPLSYYNQVMHLTGMAKGGLVALKNDADARRQSFLERGWPEPGRVGMFKNGGWLKPGQFAYNETARPEPVLSSSQWDKFDRLIAALEKTVGQPSKVIDVGGIHVTNRPTDVIQQLRFAELGAGL